MRVAPLKLPLTSPWKIAHGTSTERTNVLVRLGAAYGEGALPPYYPTTYDEAADWLNTLGPDVLDADPFALDATLAALPPGPSAARCAVDLALHDRWAQALGHPLYRCWGLRPEDAPPSSLSFGIPDDLGAFREQIAQARGWPLLKLKLGAGDLAQDEAIVAAARDVAPDMALCVDANGGWTVEDAARFIPRLERYNLLFVEQPISHDGGPEAWHALRKLLGDDAPTLVADESVWTSADIGPLAGAVDGVNIKLAKSGGLAEARRMIALARTLGLRVMLGCMIESAIAVTAAAHLAPLVDWADLDGPLYLRRDPFTGVRLDQGRLVLPDGPGLGIGEAVSAEG